MRPILLTGAFGVIARALAPHLGPIVLVDRHLGHELSDQATARTLVRGCRGVVHLAACSRVGRAEAHPVAAWRDNVTATANVLEAASEAGVWVLVASSREVYGQPAVLPAGPDTPIAPRNVYGRTKAKAEALATGRAEVAVVRLANVYGAPDDHPDRLVPAWLAASRRGEPIHVRGWERSVDLLHIDDAIDGLLRVIARLDARSPVSPVLLCSGEETCLGALAELLRGASTVVEEAPSSTEVARFVGDPLPALHTLGWRPRVPVARGLAALRSSLEVSP